MSQRIIFTYLLAVILQLCHALDDLDKIVDNMSNLYLDDSLVSPLGDMYDDAKYQVTTNTLGEVWEKTDGVATVSVATRKGVPYSNSSRNTLTLGQDLVPARRTDVVILLQEQRERDRTNEFHPNNINYEFPGETWPGITFRIPKAILSFSVPTLTLSKPKLTLKDHFQSYRPRYSANLDFLKQSSDIGLSISRNDYTLSNPIWNHHFLFNTKPTWFAYKTVPKRVTWPTNTFMRIFTDSKSTRTNTANTFLPPSKATIKEVDFFLNDNYYTKNGTRYKHLDKLRKQKGQLIERIEYSAYPLHNTTTTTTRSTRTYPQPGWICYECGRNETTFGSPFCQEVFDTQYHRLNARKSTLRYRCNGARSVSYQCFKRFVDVGWYNERGCREWPPRRSGTTYASRRLRALEVQLYGVPDGCVFTPQAFLLSYSRTVQLYVRFHVCVCSGTLCNGAAPMGYQGSIGLSVLVSVYISA